MLPQPTSIRRPTTRGRAGDGGVPGTAPEPEHLRVPGLALAFAALVAAAGLALPPTAAAALPSPPPAAAAEETPPPAPSFPIETIRVEGVRPRSEAAVVAASLLEPGRGYDERELRDAVSRIVRLPFVLAADFSLERGSHRGDYVLVITAIETKRFFFAGARHRTFSHREVRFENAGGTRDSDSGRATAGYRQPLGAYGEAFVALDTEQGAQIGLAHYNLFGSHATASAAYARNDLCCPSTVFPLALDPGLGLWALNGSEQAAARLAVPLAGNHGLRFGAEMLRSDDASRQGVLSRGFLDDDFADVPSFEHRRVEVAWVYDDSDDPLAPRRGRTWALGVEVQDLDGRAARFEFPRPATLDPVAFHGEMARAVASGVVHHPLTVRHSVSLTARLAAGRGSVDGLPAEEGELPAEELHGVEASLSATHRLMLWQPPEEFASLWLESEVGYAYEEVSPALPGALSSLGQGRAGIALVLRNAWGVFRIAVTYVDLAEGGR